MAIAFRANGATATGTTSLSCAQPTGTSTGDCLVAFIVDHATSGNSAAPTGWTRVGGIAAAAGRFQAFTAVVGQNSLTGTSWSFTGLTTRAVGYIVGFSGASTDFAHQPDVTASARSNASGTTGTTTITPGADGDMVVAGFAAFASGSTWSTQAVATAPTLSNAGGGANSTFCSVSGASGILASAAATGASSATMGTAGTNAGILLSLKNPTSATATPSGVTSTSTSNNTLGAPVGLASGVSATSAENNPTAQGVATATVTPAGQTSTSAVGTVKGNTVSLAAGNSAVSGLGAFTSWVFPQPAGVAGTAGFNNPTAHFVLAPIVITPSGSVTGTLAHLHPLAALTNQL